MELKDFFVFSFPAVVLIYLAFILGLFYLKKETTKPIKLLVFFLGFVCFIELIATYSTIAYFSDYKYFSFVKDTPFRRNTWVYNFYDLLNPIFTCIFFFFYIKNEIFKKVFSIVLGLFFLISIYFQFVATSFFEISSFVVIVGTFLILGIIFQFFNELLKSNLILSLKSYIPMYIAVGAFVFNLTTAPLAIFSDYFNVSNGNSLFVKLQIYIVLFSNLFMYSCFIIGFLVCSKKKKYS